MFWAQRVCRSQISHWTKRFIPSNSSSIQTHLLNQTEVWSQLWCLPENLSTLIVPPASSCQACWCTFVSESASLSLFVVNLKAISVTQKHVRVNSSFPFPLSARIEIECLPENTARRIIPRRGFPLVECAHGNPCPANHYGFNFRVYMLRNRSLRTWGQREDLRSTSWKRKFLQWLTFAINWV